MHVCQTVDRSSITEVRRQSTYFGHFAQLQCIWQGCSVGTMLDRVLTDLKFLTKRIQSQENNVLAVYKGEQSASQSLGAYTYFIIIRKKLF